MTQATIPPLHLCVLFRLHRIPALTNMCIPNPLRCFHSRTLANLSHLTSRSNMSQHVKPANFWDAGRYCLSANSLIVHLNRTCCRWHPLCYFKTSLFEVKTTASELSSSNNNIKHYHTPTRFTFKNPMYLTFLESLQEEYRRLGAEVSGQSSKSDDKNHQEQLRRFNFLNSALRVIEKVQAKQEEMQELSNEFQGEGDKELKIMFEKEMEKYQSEMAELEEELIEVLAGEDPADNNDITLEVAAGVGGQEAMLFCAEVYNMYCNYALRKGWTVAEVFNDESELGGTRKATVEISGQDVYKHMKYEGGVHRVQRVPKTEKAGRVHTSTITVSILPQPREIDIDIQQKDLKIDTFRGSGPGGQSVNTTDSAVRITHLPTGTVSECKQERSQLKNRDIAMKNLKSKIYQAILEEEDTKRRATRKMQMGTRARSEKIRTYNFQQDRVSDHRLKENCSNLADFMMWGEGLDDFITSLNQLDKHQILESMLDEYEAEQNRKKSGKS